MQIQIFFAFLMSLEALFNFSSRKLLRELDRLARHLLYESLRGEGGLRMGGGEMGIGGGADNFTIICRFDRFPCKDVLVQKC